MTIHEREQVENNASRGGYVLIRGDWMSAGYIDNGAPSHLAVQMIGGKAFSYDTRLRAPDTLDPPLVLDADGLIIHEGASAGYGFSPNSGEIERVAALGVTFPTPEDAA
jgi:hypothetical protein